MIIRGLVAAAIIAFLGLGAFWFFDQFRSEAFKSPTSFVASHWQAADVLQQTRCSMVHDLTRRIGLVGRTKAEIIGLLGKANREEGGFPSVYFLCPNFIDIYILELKWKHGRVSSARLRST